MVGWSDMPNLSAGCYEIEESKRDIPGCKGDILASFGDGRYQEHRSGGFQRDEGGKAHALSWRHPLYKAEANSLLSILDV